MDKVYVVYLDGKMHKNRSRKTAYLEEKCAKQVITSDAKKLAENICRADGKYFYDLSQDERREYIDKTKKRFEIVVFTRNLEN